MHNIRTLQLLAFACSLASLSAAAQAKSQSPIVGEATLVIGGARLWAEDGSSQPVERGTPVRVGDRLETAAGGHVHLRFVDGGRLSIRPASRLQVESYSHTPGQPQLGAIKFRLDEGVARSITGAWGEAARERFRLNTPVAAIGVKGTDFIVRADADTTAATVYSGAIALTPLASGCGASVGPCINGHERMLSADMKGQMLELTRSQAAPTLVAVAEPVASSLGRVARLERATVTTSSSGDTIVIAAAPRPAVPRVKRSQPCPARPRCSSLCCGNACSNGKAPPTSACRAACGRCWCRRSSAATCRPARRCHPAATWPISCALPATPWCSPISGHFVHDGVLEGRAAPPSMDGGPASSVDHVRWDERLRFRPSRQRNIVKPRDWQKQPYPFVYGQFDQDLFPTAEWRECCIKALSVLDIRSWAPDLITHDDPALIEQIRTQVLPRRGVWADADEIVLTNGAQQALYLLADLLVGARTTVGIEDPGYPDARNIFAIRTPKLVGLPVDEYGVPVDDRLSQCDYVYVTPSHQYPLGRVLSASVKSMLADKRDDKGDSCMGATIPACFHHGAVHFFGPVGEKGYRRNNGSQRPQDAFHPANP